MYDKLFHFVKTIQGKNVLTFTLMDKFGHILILIFINITYFICIMYKMCIVNLM
jgi:hypothetical protein